MLVQIVDHLWQSTLYAGGVAILAMVLRRSPAKYRYWLWFSVSVKFLVPFAWLEFAGTQLRNLGLAQIPFEAAQKLLPAVRVIRISSDPATRLALPRENWDWPLATIWAAGLLLLLLLWAARWRQLRRIVRDAVEIPGLADVPVRASSSSLEPGVIGFLKPVIIFPSAILGGLSRPEFAALLEHEIAHLKRRDNLMSVLQMVVEGLFWFYPPVWWLGARLISEREQACDQYVLAAGHRPRVYAESIVKVCRLCLGFPIACAAGVSRNSLKLRVEKIITRERALSLNAFQKALLAGAAASMLLGPVCAGLLMPQESRLTIARIAGASVPVLRHIVAATDPRITASVSDYPIKRHARHVAPGYAQLALRRDVQIGGLVPLLASFPVLPLMREADSGPSPKIGTVTRAAESTASDTDAVQREASTNIVMFGDPSGKGDPSAITCRAPQPLPGARLIGPKICLVNSRWAALARQQLHYSAAGQIMTSPLQSAPADEGVHLVYVNCSTVSGCPDARSVLSLR